MATLRDALGRFVRRAAEELSPAYSRRIARAEAMGRTRAEARGHGRRPPDEVLGQDALDSDAYERSLHVLRRMRSGESLTAAARAEGISPATARRYLSPALEQDANRRWTAKPVDRLAREMKYLTPQGYEWVAPRNSIEATKLAEYDNAVQAYLVGNERPLRRFRRMRLRLRDGTSLPFTTDLDQIDRLAAAGRLHFTSIYRLIS